MIDTWNGKPIPEPTEENLAEWDKRARQAAEWGIVYENPEAIVALIEEVQRLRGKLDVIWAALDPEWDLICDVHPDDDEIHCGWKRTVATIAMMMKEEGKE